jgi:hypothetical protein
MTTTPAAPMVRRSWYLAAADAERLDAIVDELHFQTRRPKHEVLAAVLGVVADHPDEILARLQGSAA